MTITIPIWLFGTLFVGCFTFMPLAIFMGMRLYRIHTGQIPGMPPEGTLADRKVAD